MLLCRGTEGLWQPICHQLCQVVAVVAVEHCPHRQPPPISQPHRKRGGAVVLVGPSPAVGGYAKACLINSLQAAFLCLQ